MSTSKKLSRFGLRIRLYDGLLSGVIALACASSAMASDFRKFDDGDEDEIMTQVARQTLLCNKGPLSIEETGITNRTSEHMDKADLAEELREAYIKAGGSVHTKSHQVPASGTMNLTITSEEKQSATGPPSSEHS